MGRFLPTGCNLRFQTGGGREKKKEAPNRRRTGSGFSGESVALRDDPRRILRTADLTGCPELLFATEIHPNLCHDVLHLNLLSDAAAECYIDFLSVYRVYIHTLTMGLNDLSDYFLSKSLLASCKEAVLAQFWLNVQLFLPKMLELFKQFVFLAFDNQFSKGMELSLMLSLIYSFHNKFQSGITREKANFNQTTQNRRRFSTATVLHLDLRSGFRARFGISDPVQSPQGPAEPVTAPTFLFELQCTDCSFLVKHITFRFWPIHFFFSSGIQ